jgi:hypothetical protein
MAEANGSGDYYSHPSHHGQSSGAVKYHQGEKVYAYEKSTMSTLYEAKVRQAVFLPAAHP